MSKAKYVDGFLIKVPNKKINEYKKIARYACKLWIEHGALEYREACSDDINTNFGMPFGKLKNLKKNETLFFSWITYKSKKHRDSVNLKVMSDKRMQKYMDQNKCPFDTKQMSYGGFKILISE